MKFTYNYPRNCENGSNQNLLPNKSAPTGFLNRENTCTLHFQKSAGPKSLVRFHCKNKSRGMLGPYNFISQRAK